MRPVRKRHRRNSSVGEAVIPEENTLPIVEPGSLELTYAGVDNWYTPASYSQNLEVWQEVEKRTGIKINWEVMPSDQYNAAMQTRIAAGSDLPDILAVPPLWNGDVVKYAEDGVILPLKDLIEKNAPNIMNMFEKYPIIRKVLTAPDGKSIIWRKYLLKEMRWPRNRSSSVKTGWIN